jgi:hypothetical protein
MHYSTVLSKPAGKGSGSSYSYTQTNPANGINYYQLTGTSIDGSVQIYGTTSIDIAGGCAIATTVYPNPASSRLNVNVAVNSSYRLMSVMGTVVLKGSLQAGNNVIDVSNLPDCMYILRVITNNNANSCKVIIRK